MYAAPVDQTVFQTIVVGLMCWVIYTFLYKPIYCEPEPILFTVEDVMKIIQTGMDDFHNSSTVDLGYKPRNVILVRDSSQVR